MQISKILIKLIDEAILPAVLIVTVKIISAILIVAYLQISFSLTFLNGLPKLSLASPQNILLINNLSNLFLLCFLTLVISVILLRAHFLHNTHISPKLTIKILTLNMSSLITNSFNVFTQSFVWLAFLWLTTFTILSSVVFGETGFLIATLSLLISLLLSLALVLDLEREVM